MTTASHKFLFEIFGKTYPHMIGISSDKIPDALNEIKEMLKCEYVSKHTTVNGVTVHEFYERETDGVSLCILKPYMNDGNDWFMFSDVTAATMFKLRFDQ